MKILVTGSAGFINGYVVEELLRAGHDVVGIDNYSKYGPVSKSYDDHPRYHFVEGDVKDVDLMFRLVEGCDQMVASAARIGGITYFHEYAYDLLAENERIAAAHFDTAIYAYRKGWLKKINVISSSMVFENATVFPTRKSTSPNVRPRQALTGSRSWPVSTSRMALTSSMDCRTPSSARSTVSAPANSGRWAGMKSPAGTSNSR
ncbi:NAD dependent epimerase/dehydratase family protein [Mycobacterium kansasii]|uniref:NAD dependent epimerase/dehydratase family protein n=1 Tax=Mycobacterium kansasii TaxID=1768 RepID=A0A1V3XDK8_MYCKA|nr:NAD dependent epimerase/dehydratase family protein [Mycobacterium kansasii]